jgi:hypothetical protein
VGEAVAWGEDTWPRGEAGGSASPVLLQLPTFDANGDKASKTGPNSALSQKKEFLINPFSCSEVSSFAFNLKSQLSSSAAQKKLSGNLITICCY